MIVVQLFIQFIQKANIVSQTVKKCATHVNQLSGGVYTSHIIPLVQEILAVMVVLHDTTDKEDYTFV